MFLVVAATEIELRPFLAKAGKPDSRWQPFTCGVGPVETAVRLGRRLARQDGIVAGVLMFGIGGAYPLPDLARCPGLLDICVANREVLGDFGIDLGDRFEYFPDKLGGPSLFQLDPQFGGLVAKILTRNGLDFHRGTFITVNSVSGTTGRGRIMSTRWQGICENMEGAAAARVCREFGVPFAEIRVVSNMVENRNPAAWKLEQACERAGAVAAKLLEDLL